jgi:hypothetical protein
MNSATVELVTLKSKHQDKINRYFNALGLVSS